MPGTGTQPAVTWTGACNEIQYWGCVSWMQRGDTPVRARKEQRWVGLSSCSWEARMETKPRWQKTGRVGLQRAEVMGS